MIKKVKQKIGSWVKQAIISAMDFAGYPPPPDRPPGSK